MNLYYATKIHTQWVVIVAGDDSSSLVKNKNKKNPDAHLISCLSNDSWKTRGASSKLVWKLVQGISIHFLNKYGLETLMHVDQVPTLIERIYKFSREKKKNPKNKSTFVAFYYIIIFVSFCCLFPSTAQFKPPAPSRTQSLCSLLLHMRSWLMFKTWL